MKKLYVAYGSNLNLKQMAYRCPYASIYGVGRLNNWELVYRGSIVNSHATIIRKSGMYVPVLLWNIEPEDERRLDIYEGYPRYYYKQNVMVDLDGKKKKAMVYIMNQQCVPGRPSLTYIETIRQGYIDNNFDLALFENSLDRNTIECR